MLGGHRAVCSNNSGRHRVFYSRGRDGGRLQVGFTRNQGAVVARTPKGAATAVGYLTIKSNGTEAERLVGGSVDFASSFQLHSMTMEDGVSKMRELKSVEIGPGQTLEFEPGGSHNMFVGLNRPLSKGDHIKGTLVLSTRVR